MNIEPKNCAYRTDNHAPTSTCPYRVKIGGRTVHNANGKPRKFPTLWAACVYVAENRPARS